MDRAPGPELPHEENQAELRRKRRFIDRLGAWQTRPELFGSEPGDEPDVGELWHRDGGGMATERAETELPLEDAEFTGRAKRLQQVGREVLERAHDVQDFAESVQADVAELAASVQEGIKPETERLGVAAEDLADATEQLDERLDELEDEQADSAEGPDLHVEMAGASPAEAKKPAEDAEKNGIGGMARLVIATLVGGGLGALVGGEEHKKGRKQAKEKAKADATIEQQREKMAAQEAELQQLKANRPEGTDVAGQKEHVQKAAELTENQAELTRDTTEQLQAATLQTPEQKRTFQIPEQHQASVERADKAEANEGNERPEGAQAQAQSNAAGQANNKKPIAEPAPAPIEAPVQPVEWSPTNEPTRLRRQSAMNWVYVGLLTAVVLITLGLLLFGSK